MTKRELFNKLMESERNHGVMDDFKERIKFLANTIISIIPTINSITLSITLQDYYYDAIGVSSNEIWRYIDWYAEELEWNGKITM